MHLHFTGAQPIGSLLLGGKHKPHRALACPIQVTIRAKTN